MKIINKKSGFILCILSIIILFSTIISVHIYTDYSHKDYSDLFKICKLLQTENISECNINHTINDNRIVAILAIKFPLTRANYDDLNNYIKLNSKNIASCDFIPGRLTFPPGFCPPPYLCVDNPKLIINTYVCEVVIPDTRLFIDIKFNKLDGNIVGYYSNNFNDS